MKTYELRDLDQARRFLQQGLWWQRTVSPTAATVRPALEWAMEAASGGQPLPPIGFLADLGQTAFGYDGEGRTSREITLPPGLPANVIRTYEDHVLGKVYTDWTFGRASDALRRYQGRDRARGLAFLLSQFRQRAGLPGVEFAPSVIRGLLDRPPEEVLAEGWESLRQDGVQPLLVDLYEALIACARRTAEILGPEDLFELETRGALAEEGERLARRQVLRAAASLEAASPRLRLRPAARPGLVPTRILDEDTYPVGGFTSISTRGSVESLLHSQLAYMEEGPDAEVPDLFDIKFLRDELLYYSRDENAFLRRRRTFVFLLHPDLTATRFMDADLPYQRGVMMLALLVVLVRKLTDWLSSDALAFEFLFLSPRGDEEPLAPERLLLESLLREALSNGSARVTRLSAAQAEVRCREWARRSLVHCLVLSAAVRPFQAEDTVVTHLQIDGSRPALDEPITDPVKIEAEDAFESWVLALERIAQRWV